MLILTRKNEQTITIGDDITVTIYTDSPDTEVRVGVEAPKEVKILRGELGEESYLDE